MKRALFTLFGIITLYVIYIDLTEGTLPALNPKKSVASVETIANEGPDIPSFKAEVEPGQTLISIVENHINESLPVSIEELIQDFQKLNPGQKPEKIQIGSSYLFPDYSE